jgi:hypothetical protein
MNEPALNGGPSCALVITADEERIMAHETAACLARAGAARSHP